MEIRVWIPEYSPAGGLINTWVDGAEIQVRVDAGEVVLTANKEGLESLAGHLLTLAQEGVPSGHHFHLSGGHELEEGSVDLILEKSTA